MLDACFNPRARAGRDARLLTACAGRSVSIHAPARGATYARIQITAHAWFQSTRPRGARPSGRGTVRGVPSVSIHAPARGATRLARRHLSPYGWFQSTRPRGARRSVRHVLHRLVVRFNPRARAGRDGDMR